MCTGRTGRASRPLAEKSGFVSPVSPVVASSACLREMQMFFHVFCARRVSAPWSTYLPLRRALRCAWDGVQKYSAQCSSHICEAMPNPLCRQGKEAKLTPKPADPQATLIYTHIRRTYGDQQCWKFVVKARRSHHAQTHRKNRRACRHHDQHAGVGAGYGLVLAGMYLLWPLPTASTRIISTIHAARAPRCACKSNMATDA